MTQMNLTKGVQTVEQFSSGQKELLHEEAYIPQPASQLCFIHLKSFMQPLPFHYVISTGYRSFGTDLGQQMKHSSQLCSSLL